MRTLWRYYSLRFLQAFAGALLILALMVVVVDMLLNWGDIMAAQETLGGAIRVLLLRTAASYLTYLIPVAAFAGTFIVIGQAARSLEVMALRAGGISPLRAFVPLLLVAIVLSAFTLWLNETVGRAAAVLMAQDAGLTSDSIELRSGTWWYHSGRVVYSGQDPNATGSSIRDARVFVRDDGGQLVRTIHASTAHRESDKEWRFEHAIVRTFDTADPSRAPTVTRADEITLALESLRNLRLDARELAALRLPQLMTYIDVAQGRGADTGPARSIFHSRLSVPIVVLLFVSFAIPLALSVEQSKSLALPTLHGIAILTAFLVLREYTGGIAFRVGGSMAYLPWILVVLFLTWSSTRLLRVPR
jgi:lipopolysaccharide export system permease protein